MPALRPKPTSASVQKPAGPVAGRAPGAAQPAKSKVPRAARPTRTKRANMARVPAWAQEVDPGRPSARPSVVRTRPRRRKKPQSAITSQATRNSMALSDEQHEGQRAGDEAVAELEPGLGGREACLRPETPARRIDARAGIEETGSEEERGEAGRRRSARSGVVRPVAMGVLARTNGAGARQDRRPRRRRRQGPGQPGHVRPAVAPSARTRPERASPGRAARSAGATRGEGQRADHRTPRTARTSQERQQRGQGCRAVDVQRPCWQPAQAAQAVGR